MKIADLTFDPQNANRGTERGRKALASSLKKFGAGRSILLDRKGAVIAGNKTLEQAIAAGHKNVQVVKTDGKQLIAVQRTDLDLKDAKAKGLAIADNRVAELDLEWNPEALAEIEKRVDISDFWSPEEFDKLLGREPEAAPEPKLDQAAALQRKWGTKLGQLWVIGRHRLLCGDSTKKEDVARLWGTQTARDALCVTDPPYGVNYDPNWRSVEAEKGNLAYAASRVGVVANDDRADWRAAWELFDGDVIYSWHPAGATSLIHAAALQDSGFVLRMQIIWAKSNFPIGRGDYHVRHEPCWYAIREGRPARRTDDRTQTTLWEINLDRNVAGGHSTQKPLECMARPIRNHDFPSVYDPFVGSGTTICAAEQLNRTSYALEIEPKYVAVTLERMSDMGLKPKLDA